MSEIAKPPTAAPARPAVAVRAVTEMGERPMYVFELPVRLAHWAIFLACVALTVTGCWIAFGDLPAGVSMATARFVHVLSGWALVAAMLARVAWMFLGNRFASWREWIPTSRARLEEAWGVLAFYAFVRRRYPGAHGGHNVLAGAAYAGAYALLAFLAVSGFALHALGAPGDLCGWFGWPLAWIEPQTLRFLHHACMYLIWTFTVIHVGIATLIDHADKGNCMSAIVSGWRSRLSVEPPHEPEGPRP